jgi:cytochrome c biogenesis protein CcmG/thiol:disulfide interchange protein DsbE
MAPAARPPAPGFTLVDSTGAQIALSAYRGKVVVLDFWATWCTGCKVEIPWFMEFEEKYHRDGLRTLGAAMDDEGWPEVRPYISLHPISYPILIGNQSLAKPFGVASLPVTILIDRAGRIADVHRGIVDKGAWEAELQALLRER